MATMNTKGSQALATSTTGSGETPPLLQLRTATVTAIDSATTPWTVTITLSGRSVSEVYFMGWFDPRVGDNVQVLQQGESLLVLGTMGPGKVYMPPTPPPPPPAPIVPPPPPGTPGGAPVTKAYAISAIGSGTWPSQQPIGSWSNIRLWQGGGIAQRAYWFYGNRIAEAKGAGTILSGTVFIKRWSAGGVFQGANVRLGAHGLATQPGSAGALSAVTNVGQLNQDQGKTFVIPADIIAGMNAGTFKGLGLEPGALGYVTPDYLIAYPFNDVNTWSGSISLNISK